MLSFLLFFFGGEGGAAATVAVTVQSEWPRDPLTHINTKVHGV